MASEEGEKKNRQKLAQGGGEISTLLR